ncbi:MAG: 5'-methylthioadenosine/S-adenosylhomocysteine nucleosidase [Lachnospiraceae bacterium]|nr:5'-methylthioadenosine/S-adenosylhomocysteine nucleosidase [Lachnospiraceae bacterium]
MRYGFIVAIEMDAIFEHYGNCRELESPQGFRVFLVERDLYEIYILQAGMGEIAAAAGVQYLITKYDVNIIVNFGVVGGLTADMKKHKVCLVDRVVHYKYDCSEFMDLAVGQVDGHDSIFLPLDENLKKAALSVMEDLSPVTCCSGDKFVATEEEKKHIHDTFEGDICDMESAGIVLTCEANGVPVLMLKAVSDGLADGAEGFYNELKKASLMCLIATDTIMEHLSKA